jgi:hypothetical protein
MTKKTMRNPDNWIGKRVRHLDWSEFEWDYGKCDDCQCFYRLEDLWGFLYPTSDEDFDLQDALHIEEAESFCEACTGQLERDADQIDPDWRKRHGLE